MRVFLKDLNQTEETSSWQNGCVISCNLRIYTETQKTKIPRCKHTVTQNDTKAMSAQWQGSPICWPGQSQKLDDIPQRTRHISPTKYRNKESTLNTYGGLLVSFIFRTLVVFILSDTWSISLWPTATCKLKNKVLKNQYVLVFCNANQMFFKFLTCTLKCVWTEYY